ncbi:MAG: hypothetical protein GC201_11025 [Alphaproteobacteria bacterium]|nr:hypothetical protein [Alphaproteobacteria bacterium]
MAGIGDILARKWPGAEWLVRGDEYASLVWRSDGTAPTEAAIRAYSDEVDVQIAREAMIVIQRQFRRPLLGQASRMGNAMLLDDCDGLAAGASREAQEDWRCCTVVERPNPWIVQFAAVLGLTDVESDAIFDAAALIGA